MKPDKCNVKGCDNQTDFKLQTYKRSGEVDFSEYGDVISLCQKHYRIMELNHKTGYYHFIGSRINT